MYPVPGHDAESTYFRTFPTIYIYILYKPLGSFKAQNSVPKESVWPNLFSLHIFSQVFSIIKSQLSPMICHIQCQSAEVSHCNQSQSCCHHHLCHPSSCLSCLSFSSCLSCCGPSSPCAWLKMPSCFSSSQNGKRLGSPKIKMWEPWGKCHDQMTPCQNLEAYITSSIVCSVHEPPVTQAQP